MGARQRPSLQPVQGPVRSLRARGRAPHALARLADRPRRQQPAGPRHPGQRAVGAAGGRHRRRLRLGRRSPAGDAAAGHGPVRAARPRLHAAPSRRPREPARLVPGSRLRAGDRAPEVARRDRGRAPARPRPRRRAAPGRSRADQLLGLQHARVLRPRVALRLRVPAARGGARVQDDGPGAARGRARGDPRRRLQPHRRRQPSRAHAGLPRPRQRGLLPAPAGAGGALRGFHRLRQHAERPPPAGAEAGDGQPALLGHRDARRRLPLRPRAGDRPRDRQLRPVRARSSTPFTRTRSCRR